MSLPLVLLLVAFGGFLMLLRKAGFIMSPNPPGWGPMVVNAHLLAGVDLRLVEMWRQWSFQGSHVMTPAHGVWGGVPYTGGVRNLAEQRAAAEAGLSKASSAATAPHMHAGATDGWPQGFRPDRSFADQVNGELYREQFAVWAQFGEDRGFGSGRGWNDWPHHEVPDWAIRPVGADPSTLDLSSSFPVA